MQRNDGKSEQQMARTMDFWRARGVEIENVAHLARYCILIVSSSAAAERVFSALKHSYSLVQLHHALEDLTETQVMLQYNHRGEIEAELLAHPDEVGDHNPLDALN